MLILPFQKLLQTEAVPLTDLGCYLAFSCVVFISRSRKSAEGRCKSFVSTGPLPWTVCFGKLKR